MRALLPIYVLLALLLSGCGPNYIGDTEIEDTPENREVLTMVEDYRRAIETRDIGTLQQLVSRRYYENASTTDVDEDDYGRDEVLVSVLPMLAESVQKVFYKVRVTSIAIRKEHALVDFEYVLKFRFLDGTKSQWALKSDVNQLELVREEGSWRILSGM